MTTTWTPVSKASGTSWTKQTSPKEKIGSPIGLLLSLTYATGLGENLWTKITKASGTSWTKVTKAT